MRATLVPLRARRELRDGRVSCAELFESEPLEVDAGYAIFRVLEKKEVSREEYGKVKATERGTLLEQEKNKFLQSYMAKARVEKKVRINYDTFLRLNNDVISRFTKTP